jgi:hypothetical protein
VPPVCCIVKSLRSLVSAIFQTLLILDCYALLSFSPNIPDVHGVTSGDRPIAMSRVDVSRFAKPPTPVCGSRHNPRMQQLSGESHRCAQSFGTMEETVPQWVEETSRRPKFSDLRLCRHLSHSRFRSPEYPAQFARRANLDSKRGIEAGRASLRNAQRHSDSGLVSPLLVVFHSLFDSVAAIFDVSNRIHACRIYSIHMSSELLNGYAPAP